MTFTYYGHVRISTTHDHLRSGDGFTGTHPGITDVCEEWPDKIALCIVSFQSITCSEGVDRDRSTCVLVTDVLSKASICYNTSTLENYDVIP